MIECVIPIHKQNMHTLICSDPEREIPPKRDSACKRTESDDCYCPEIVEWKRFTLRKRWLERRIIFECFWICIRQSKRLLSVFVNQSLNVTIAHDTLRFGAVPRIFLLPFHLFSYFAHPTAHWIIYEKREREKPWTKNMITRNVHIFCPFNV